MISNWPNKHELRFNCAVYTVHQFQAQHQLKIRFLNVVFLSHNFMDSAIVLE